MTTPARIHDRGNGPEPELSSLVVPAPYRPLHKYLDGRYADIVVLKFVEIEDLLGFSLPDLARLGPEWWADDSTAASHSCAWRRANRTARLNRTAQTVTFERRLPERL